MNSHVKCELMLARGFTRQAGSENVVAPLFRALGSELVEEEMTSVQTKQDAVCKLSLGCGARTMSDCPSQCLPAVVQ